MKLKRVILSVVAAAGLSAASLTATAPQADAATCGFHFWRQSYTNCLSHRESVVISYEEYVGTWIYTSHTYCIGAGATRYVNLPGLLAVQTTLNGRC